MIHERKTVNLKFQLIIMKDKNKFKPFLYLIIGTFIITTSFTYSNSANHSLYSSSCSVHGIYQAQSAPVGSKGIDDYGDLYDLDKVLTRTTVDAGRYKVTVSRKGNNLYDVIGTDLYLETFACYEYVYYKDAVLEVTTRSGISVGTLHFK